MRIKDYHSFEINVQTGLSQDIEQTHPHEDRGLHDVKEAKSAPFWNFD